MRRLTEGRNLTTASPGTTAAIAISLLLIDCLPRPALADAAILSEVTVTSQRRSRSTLQEAGNIALLSRALLTAVSHQHTHELMTRVPGAWVSRGSGQEHLTAIRSPVLTGAGSCGSFLVLEDSIPVRPPGFCNVNQLFELNTEMARQIEVIRGPGNALYGSNALHGIINVLMPVAGDPTATSAGIEVGANSFTRARLQLVMDERPATFSFVYADDSGFRADSGYRQAKMHGKSRWSISDGTVDVALSATSLRQETAGFILGQDAYENPNLNRSNANPEAFRDADSVRLYSIVAIDRGEANIDIRPYLRYSDMRFLQHFLPGKPLEENGHISGGVLSKITFDRPHHTWMAGIDIEWSDAFLKQTQIGSTEGSAFLQETRPEGKHYDYDVEAFSVAPWIQATFQASDRLTIDAGMRLEHLHYDYRNNMLSGNTRDDGSICGFGGCLYSRPESREDSFNNAAPKLSANLRVSDQLSFYGAVSRGFRAPQATELYRLQNAQRTADLDSERLDNVELGLRGGSERMLTDVAIFAMRKRGSVLRDSEGFNVSQGRSHHAGIETSIDWRLGARATLNIDLSYARHEYDFNLVASRGETFNDGNDIDTAPRLLASAEIVFDASATSALALQWTMIDSYFLDAENRFTYPGHELLNLRVNWQASRRLLVTARLNNVLDEEYADRADYAFGNYRYFPGRGREFFLELRYSQ
ncbi:MAG: TonB-dependent receptor [Gammaproteobacteria bacterium]|nr:TonB-dependent receptor [Gammaproteobacteria bacterium]